MTQEISEEEFNRAINIDTQLEAKTSGCKVCSPVKYELSRVEQGYSSVATYRSSGQKYINWVVPIKAMTFRVQVPSELGRCDVSDLETGVMLGCTDDKGIFEMPHRLFTLLSRRRICHINDMILEAGPIEERKLLKATNLVISTDKAHVNDLVSCARNTPIYNMELVDTGVQANDNQYGSGRENFNITCLCTRENVILKSEGSAIFRMC